MKEFDAIIGYEGIKEELRQTADILRNLDVYKDAGARTPSGMLIHGDPGLGKSLMAECLIAAAGVPTFIVRKDKSDGDFVDFIKHTFEEAAASAPSIVYLDDMDKFANADADHRNADEYVAVQSAIDSVRGKDVFVLATTNELHCLPNSLTRSGRFDRRVNVLRPNGKEAEDIIRHYLSGKQLGDDVEWDDVAMLMDGRTCADLESTLNEALLISISRREDVVSRSSFMDAFLKTRVQRPFIPDGDFFERNEEERMRTAIHEAGHAVVFEVLADKSVSLISAFSKTDNRGGVTSFRKPADCSPYRWSELEILGGLGGIAATDLVYGEVDAGATNDLDRVTDRIARRCDKGMAFAMPHMGIPHYQESNEGKWRFETLVHAELTRELQKTKQVLAANREFFDKITEAIVENDYLISSDIQAIKRTCEIVSVAI